MAGVRRSWVWGIGAPTQEIARQGSRSAQYSGTSLPRRHCSKWSSSGGSRDSANEPRQCRRPRDPGSAYFTFVALVVDEAQSKNAFADAPAAAGVNVQTVASGMA